MISVTRRLKSFQTVSKGPPYGDCQDQPLDYFDLNDGHTRYTLSRCMAECETKFLENLCKCREPYMPGNVQERRKI